jgi:hypothetical protein
MTITNKNHCRSKRNNLPPKAERQTFLMPSQLKHLKDKNVDVGIEDVVTEE